MQYTSQKARFSRCRQYRYSLERTWRSGSGSVVFIGLNPSTADHKCDDPTIRRCVGFAKNWGYQSMAIVNLFAFRATQPELLKQAPDPVGPRNDFWIQKLVNDADLAVACWGNHGKFLERDSAVQARLPKLHCISQNSSHQPSHPLYLRANLIPVVYKQY